MWFAGEMQTIFMPVTEFPNPTAGVVKKDYPVAGWEYGRKKQQQLRPHSWMILKDLQS